MHTTNPLSQVLLNAIFGAVLLTMPFLQVQAEEIEIPEITAGSPYSSYSQQLDSYREAVNERGNAEDNEEIWRSVAADQPDDLLLRAYWASSISLIARDSWMPWNKIAFAEEAIKVFESIDEAFDDQAVRDEMVAKPGFHTNVLFDAWNLQARTLLNLPDGIFKTHARGKEILEDLFSHPQYASASQDFRESMEEYATSLKEE